MNRSEEKSVETVLCDKKTINLDGRKIKTRVLEERAFEWDEDEDGVGDNRNLPKLVCYLQKDQRGLLLWGMVP